MLKDWIEAEVNAFLLEYDILTCDIPEAAVKRLVRKIMKQIEDDR